MTRRFGRRTPSGERSTRPADWTDPAPAPAPAPTTGRRPPCRRARRPRRDETGSVLLLVIGFAGLLLVLVAVVVDASVVFLAKRAAASAADGAAVSAAQALDLDAVYAAGVGAQLPLSADLARSRVAAYEGLVRRQQPGLRLAVRLEGTTAVVTAVRPVDLPFRLPGIAPVQVRARASARAPVLP